MADGEVKRSAGQAAGRDATRAAIATVVTIIIGPVGFDFLPPTEAAAIGGACGLLIPRLFDYMEASA